MIKKKEETSAMHSNSNVMSFPKILITAKNDEQKLLLKTISENTITFVTGSPGTGKTFLTLAYGLQLLAKEKVKRIVLTRPVIEAAGERLGFLPGDMTEKINPYLMPIYEILSELMPPENVNKLMSKSGKEGPIRIIPLAYMRGNTFHNTYVMCEESQNSSPEQIRMLLTRLGDNSKIVLCGDLKQSDIKQISGLEDSSNLLKGIDDIGHVHLSIDAIVRHPLVQTIERKYEERSEKLKNKKRNIINTDIV